MKRFLILIITAIIFLFHFCLANDISKDFVDIYSNDSVNSGIDVVLIGGMGLAYFHGSVENYFNKSPAFDVGLEIPFTQSHIFSFELLTHSWIAHRIRPIESDDFIDRRYIKISKDIYTQIGFSGVVKLYVIGSKKSKARIYIHFGWEVGPKEYSAMDAGLGINYKLNDDFRLQFGGRILFGIPNMADGSRQTTPSLIFINICYNFKW